MPPPSTPTERALFPGDRTGGLWERGGLGTFTGPTKEAAKQPCLWKGGNEEPLLKARKKAAGWTSEVSYHAGGRGTRVTLEGPSRDAVLAHPASATSKNPGSS